jgi:hypothetical protein
MTSSGIAFLALVIGAMAAFSIVLAWVSHDAPGPDD